MIRDIPLPRQKLTVKPGTGSYIIRCLFTDDSNTAARGCHGPETTDEQGGCQSRRR